MVFVGEGIKARVHKSNAWAERKDSRGSTERRPNLYLNLAILLGFLSLKSYLCWCFISRIQQFSSTSSMIIGIIFNDLPQYSEVISATKWAVSGGTESRYRARRYCSSRFPVFVCLFNTHSRKWWVLAVRSGKNFAIWGFPAEPWPWWKQSGLFLHWGAKQNCPPPHSKREKPQAAGPLLQSFPIDKRHKVLFGHGSGARHLWT